MRKFLPLLFALVLTGCVGFNPFASFTNPVSSQTLAKAEEGYGVALSAAVAYRNSCAQRLIPPSCRPIVKQIQLAENYAHGQLLVARNFVNANPTVDATVIIATAQQAVQAFQSVASANGVR